MRISWQVGSVIDGLYEILAVFSSGGMGTVYRVRHLGWNIDLALKHPKPELLGDPDTVILFEQECEAWVGIGLHPHVATCHYTKKVSNVPCVFAEFVDGGSLRDWIASKRLYHGEEAAIVARIIGIAIQFSWGLAWAHQHRLIHSDVKPGNVLMTSDGLTKVTDFGLAKAGRCLTANDTSLFVNAGGMTPGYCSPEQAAYGELTFATDVWSWAVSVLEMFMGGICWQHGPAACAALTAYGEQGRRTRCMPEMPVMVFKLLGECLQRNPAQRPTDFKKIAALLCGFYRELFGEDFELDEPDEKLLIPDALNNRAVSLVDLGRIDEASALLKQALALESDHPEALYNSSLLIANLHRTTALRLAVPRSGAEYSHNTRRFKRLMEKARIAAGTGRRDDALRYLHTARELPGFERHPAIRAFNVSLKP
ncbi:MAG: protein kinase [Verrucomicrobia bacterium]|nr:protein kinase [Verrucomicrobiota bacterium]